MLTFLQFATVSLWLHTDIRSAAFRSYGLSQAFVPKETCADSGKEVSSVCAHGLLATAAPSRYYSATLRMGAIVPQHLRALQSSKDGGDLGDTVSSRQRTDLPPHS